MLYVLGWPIITRDRVARPQNHYNSFDLDWSGKNDHNTLLRDKRKFWVCWGRSHAPCRQLTSIVRKDVDNPNRLWLPRLCHINFSRKLELLGVYFRTILLTCQNSYFTKFGKILRCSAFLFSPLMLVSFLCINWKLPFMD